MQNLLYLCITVWDQSNVDDIIPKLLPGGIQLVRDEFPAPWTERLIIKGNTDRWSLCSGGVPFFTLLFNLLV